MENKACDRGWGGVEGGGRSSTVERVEWERSAFATSRSSRLLSAGEWMNVDDGGGLVR